MKKIKAALLDLYNNEPNLGIGNIEEILLDFDLKINNTPVDYKIYNVRGGGDIPSIDNDIFISSGGPGDPFDGKDKKWEKDYFNLLDKIRSHNQNSVDKKHVFFICHSFQLMARYFEIAEVTKRRSRSFGVFPVHQTEAGKADDIFSRLPDPFYAADFRSWQVVQPDDKKIKELGAEILALEKERSHVNFERAVMAMKVGDEFFGTQFHPEADPVGMKYHYREEKKKQNLIKDVGEEKYENLMEILEEPEKVELTYRTVLPVFLERAIISKYL